jgi:LysR family transcriptional activator of nhaA
MQTLNYHHLFYFWIVAKEGSFTRASEKLRLSQSAISEQVRRLEESFGQKLIVRTTRSFELTEAGLAAIQFADQIFETGQELMGFMKNKPTQKSQIVRIGAIGSLSRNLQVRFLEPILGKPNVQFTVVTGDASRLLRLLRDHELDIVLSTSTPKEEFTDQVYTHLLTESPLCLVAAKTIQARKPKNLEDYFKTNRIYLPTHASESRSAFDHYIESIGVKLRVEAEVEDVALLRLLALTGKGPVIIPKIGVQAEVQDGRLKVIHEFRSMRQRYYALTRQKQFPNSLVAELIQAWK